MLGRVVLCRLFGALELLLAIVIAAVLCACNGNDLARGGEAIFSCNLRSFKPDIAKLEKYGVQIEDISADTIPPDFARTPKIHKCYRVRRT